nr:PcfJ domain-containing protein [Flavobacterium sp. IB48]
MIFSARIDNTPVETIEISPSKMEITKCRGLKNK